MMEPTLSLGGGGGGGGGGAADERGRTDARRCISGTLLAARLASVRWHLRSRPTAMAHGRKVRFLEGGQERKELKNETLRRIMP